MHTRSIFDPLDDTTDNAKDGAEGHGQTATIVDHQLVASLEDCGASQVLARKCAPPSS
jgi:hypothetical protein